MSHDRIEIRGLTVRGFHGVYDEERRDGQDFVVDVVLDTDLAAAGATDDLTRTVDYGTLAGRIAEVVAGDPVDLIETVATRIADLCLADSRVDAVTVTVRKPQAPVTVRLTDVGVVLRRTRA